MLDAQRIAVPEPATVLVATEDVQRDLLTPLTVAISAFRNRNFHNRGLVVRYQPQEERCPAERPPTDSYISITYPFSSNALLRDQYQRFHTPFLRVGLLLEDLDAFAADIAGRHLGGLPAGATIVTASIDKLAFTTAGGTNKKTKRQLEVEEVAIDIAAAASQSLEDDLTAFRAYGRKSSRKRSAGSLHLPIDSLPPQAEECCLSAAETDAADFAVDDSGGDDDDDDDDVSQLPDQLDAEAIDWLSSTASPMSIYSKLRIAGQVCWAGRSSMEVLVEISSEPPAPALTSQGSAGSAAADSAGIEWVPRGLAHFLMVLKATPQAAAGAAAGWRVPQVVPSSELELAHFEQAAARAAHLKARRGNNKLLGSVDPAPEELQLLYDLAEQQLKRQILQRVERELELGAGCRAKLTHADSIAVRTRSSPAMLMADKARQAAASPQACQLDPVPIAATVQTQVSVMHRQDRNNANNIFGGHLLRLASELAYCTGVLHAGRECEIVALGDVNFLQPVPIGCVLALRAKVTYTSGHLMRVAVIATKHQQLLGRSTEGLETGATNDFTFVLAVIGADQLRPVEPESMREALQYLASHRQHVSDGYEVPELLMQQGAEALWARRAGC